MMDSPDTDSPAIDTPDIAVLVAAAGRCVADRYVFADLGVMVGDFVLARLGEGAYDGASTEFELSALLTPDLQSVNADKHLRLAWREHVIEEEADEAAWMPIYIQRAQDNAYGLASLPRLAGNVAVLDISPELFAPSIAGDTQVAGLRSVADAAALIIDARACRGGSPEAVALICTYLLGTDIHLSDMVARDAGDLRQMWTLPWVPGPVFGTHKPVAVLTSSDSFSGAEDLAYTLQAAGRAKVVGEITGGGAHPCNAFRLTDHLEVIVPTARTVNVTTQTNWEGVGVIPDIPVPAADALQAALAALTALTALGA